MVNVIVNDMLKRHACYFLEKNTGKENDRQGKGQEKKENRKYLHFIFNLFYHYSY